MPKAAQIQAWRFFFNGINLNAINFATNVIYQIISLKRCYQYIMKAVRHLIIVMFSIL